MEHLFDRYRLLSSVPISDYINFIYQIDEQQKSITHSDYCIKTDYTIQEFISEKEIDLKEDHFHLIKDGWTFDILLTRHQEKKLFVLFGGARNINAKNLYPFPRWSYFPFMPGNVLSIVDPMFYKFPNLKLGWYYGTKDYCLLQTTSTIIKKIQKQLQISDKETIFIGSSGGGYASLEISKYFNNTTHLAINPQIRIDRYNDNTNFSYITGIDLNDRDPYGRNTTDDFIATNKNCEYIIIQNARDESHCIGQLFPFLQKMGITALNIGINKYNNITLWIFNCVATISNAHSYTGDQFTFSFMLLLQYIKDFQKPFIDFLYKNISIQQYQKSVAEARSTTPQLLFEKKSHSLREWLLFFSCLPRDIQMERLHEILASGQQECEQDPRLALAALRAYASMWLGRSLPLTAAPWRMLPTCLSEIFSHLPHKWSIALLEKIRRTKPSSIMGRLFLAWGYHFYRNSSREYYLRGEELLKKLPIQKIPDLCYGFAALVYLKYTLVEKIRPILYKHIRHPVALPAEIGFAFAAAALSMRNIDIQYILYNIITIPDQQIHGFFSISHWSTMRKEHMELPQFFFPKQGYPLTLTLYNVPLYFRNIKHARQCIEPCLQHLLAEARVYPEYWQQTLAANCVCRMKENVALCAWEMFKLRLLTPRHMQELEKDGFKDALAGLQKIIDRFVKTHSHKFPP